MCVCVCVCVCLNNIDILCLHIFVFIRSSRRIDFMVSSWNWLINLQWLIGSLVLSVRSWAIVKGVYITKAMRLLHVYNCFVIVKRLLFILVCCKMNATTRQYK